MFNSLQEMIYKTGVCCLTENPKHILMWSHYGNNHEGFCLQFRHIAEPFFGIAEKVRYKAEYIKINALLDSSEEQGMNIFYNRAQEWAYEEEWRIVKTDGIGQYSFPPESLVGVIFGSRMSEKNKGTIRKWVNLRVLPVKIMQAKLKDNCYGIDVPELMEE